MDTTSFQNFFLGILPTVEKKLFFSRAEWPQREVRQSSPSDLMRQRDLHTFELDDGSRDTSLEKGFSQFETTVAPVVSSIIDHARANSLPRLTEEQRELLTAFFYHQMRRVPEFNDPHLWLGSDEEFVKNVHKIAQEKGVQLSIEELAMLNDPRHLERLKNNARVTALGTFYEQVPSELRKLTLAVLKVEKKSKAFIIGSSPVLKLASEAAPKLSDTSTQVYLPLSSDVAVLLRHSEQEALYSVSEAYIRRLNLIMTARSRVVAGRSESLIQSLTGAVWK